MVTFSIIRRTSCIIFGESGKLPLYECAHISHTLFDFITVGVFNLQLLLPKLFIFNLVLLCGYVTINYYKFNWFFFECFESNRIFVKYWRNKHSGYNLRIRAGDLDVFFGFYRGSVVGLDVF
jgi:hypothetical protein